MRGSTRHCGVLTLLALMVFLSGCSPWARLEVRLLAPTGTALTAERLFVAGVKTCPPGALSTPSPGPNPGDVEYHQPTVVSGGLKTVIAFRGRHCNVQVSAWYDTDNDNKVSRGDYLATVGPIVVRDRGLFGGNLTSAPDVRLSLVP